MVDKLADYMCDYLQSRTESLKGCLIAALNSNEGYLSLLDESLGTPVQNQDLKLCGLLASAGLFRVEIQLTRDGRNRYKLFYLTDKGRELASEAKAQGYSGPIPKSAIISA
jgi:hypothetical protein